MLFSSITFLFVFLPIVLVFYYIVPQRFKNMLLLAFSLFFYAWGEPVYVILMILSILFNYYCGLNISAKLDSHQKAKHSMIFGITVNILLLGIYKYYGFFVGILNNFFVFHIPQRELNLPIGISFYTFQALSYLVDVYRKNVKSQGNIINFALYISMFPQLIAGPIVRYVDIEKQINYREITMSDFGEGVRCFIIGLGKKAILANSVGNIFHEITANGFGDSSMLTVWIGAIAYTMQIYFDFSGYSDMAIGLGRMFGFQFLKNFDLPYTSLSITEFWRRWHISLSTWFREYVYIPLGGNRKGRNRQILNLFVVWTLTGLWHGASFNFMFWGFYYGMLLVLEKFVWGNKVKLFPKILQHIYCLFFIVIGWVFFFSTDMASAWSYLGKMFGIGNTVWIDKTALSYIMYHWLLWLMMILCSRKNGRHILDKLDNQATRKWPMVIFYSFVFFTAVSCLITDTFNPFLYFRF